MKKKQKSNQGKKGTQKQSQPRQNGESCLDHPSYKGPIRSRDANFALLVKTLFGILQCLHHGSIQKNQVSGQFGKAFHLKINELNRFVKPACTNPLVQQAIQNVNLRWASEIYKALARHYADSLKKLNDTAQQLLLDHNLDLERAKQIALSWAQRNYKKKLDKSTVDNFKTIVLELVNSGPRTSSCPVPSAYQKRTSPHGNGTTTMTSTPPFRPEPAVASTSTSSPHPPSYAQVTLSGSKTAISPLTVGGVSSVMAKSRTPPRGNQTPSPLAQPSPTRLSSGQNCTKRRTVNSDKNLRPTRLTYKEHSPHKGSKNTKSDGNPMDHSPLWRAPNTHFKDRDWVIPALPVSARTVVIGTSNISSITERPADPTLALFSYPGAKFRNFKALFQKSSIYPHVERVVFSCGINDRSSSPEKSVFPELKRALSGARRVFPKASVFFVTPQCDTALPSNETKNVARLNQMVEGDKNIPGMVHLIPPIATRSFKTVHDKIHWTTDTATSLLKHWLQVIQHPSKN